MKKSLLYTTFLILILVMTPLSGISIEENKNDEKSFSNPKPASASVYNLGLKSYENGDVQSAITYFKRAIDLDPDFVDAYYNLGAIYKKQKNYYNAIRAFQKAVEINPEDHEVTFELASCYLEDKNYPKAKEYFSLIPTDFAKYNDAKQNIEKINRYVVIENAAKTGQTEVIKTPETQAQLLVDKLEKSLVETGSGEVQKADTVKDSAAPSAQNPTLPKDQEQLLVNTLTKPTKDSFKAGFKTVTGNLSGPAGIVKDSKGNIFIANFTKDSIEKINTDGSKEIFIEKVGISGPLGLAVDENDNLYVANYNGNSILKISPNKTVSVIVEKVIKPYYLFYDFRLSKLYATVQGNDSLVEIDTQNLLKQPITTR
ncbi:MAG: tetratricopeptide repeat protein [Candidatus Melainabacteria bacterium]|nr:tetratricopeptide repeat protein [Candidatus Melainabacteria bacterium]